MSSRTSTDGDTSSLGSTDVFDAVVRAVELGDSGGLLSLLGSGSTAGRLGLPACVFVAVKLGAAGVLRELLEHNAPAEFLVRDLPPLQQQQLSHQGVSADGVQHMTPLVIAVRQQNLETTRVLLERGAYARSLCGGMPLLSHFGEAAQAAAALGRDWSSAPPPEHTEAMVRLLLEHGADPLQQSVGNGLPPTSFLGSCREPRLLRIAVRHVLAACRNSQRDLSPQQSAELVEAALRAFEGGS